MINLFVSLSKRRGRWRFLLAAALATAALGLWGMRLAPDGRTFLDDLYQLRDLFSFGLSLELGNANWQLQVARWLGPLVAAASLLEGLAALSRRRADAFRARRTRGHTVVLGLGDRGIADRRRRWPRPGATWRRSRSTRPRPASAALRHRDGTGRRGRRAAAPPARGRPGADRGGGGRGVRHRRHQRRGGGGHLRPSSARPAPARCDAAVHLSDAGLCALMRHQSLRTATRGVRFDFFDVYSAGARLLLSYHPLADAANGATAAPGDRRRRPVRPLPARGHGARVAATATTTITIIDRDAEARLQAILLAQPGLAERSPDRRRRHRPRPARPRRRGAAAPALARGVTTVAVCFDDDARAVTTALLIRRLLGNAPTEVIARTSGTGGLSLLLGEGATAAGVIPVPAARAGLHARDRRGRRARAGGARLHADYTDRTVGTPYDIPWDELPPDVQESNRRQADRSPPGLAAIGCDLVPLGGWGVPHVELTPDEVEVLAPPRARALVRGADGGRVALRPAARQRAAPEPAAGGVGRAAGGRAGERPRGGAADPGRAGAGGARGAAPRARTGQPCSPAG